ncbi:hypothetical protein [Acinetobacter calcoaceticus]|uniref:hypothetical protein n=1 Tax=Acinetobacter calcoaceticus TaxID=471 RepID=UPI00124D0CD6|nr:hypothetical protein [Acinetobacter calcoaceticus]
MAEKFSEHENLIIQTFINFMWLYEMDVLKFNKSDAYNELKFHDDFVKNMIYERGIINQGVIPVALYVMLVIPKETIYHKYKSEYEGLNTYISKNLNVKVTTSTYAKDVHQIDFLRHLRNSISHMKFEMTKVEGSVIFNDESPKKEQFSCEITYLDIGAIIEQLKQIHLKYLKEIQENKRKI